MPIEEGEDNTLVISGDGGEIPFKGPDLGVGYEEALDLARRARKSTFFNALYRAGPDADKINLQDYQIVENKVTAALVAESGPALDEDPVVDLTQEEIDMIVYALDYVSLEKVAEAFGIAFFEANTALNRIYNKLCD